MAQVQVIRIVDASASEVWKAWDEYGDIADFHPGLASSHLLPNSKGETGVGALRQCNLADGKNHIKERITEYIPEKRMTVDIYEGTLPLKTAVATFELVPQGPQKTKVTMTMDFTPKMGIIGRLMVPMMKMGFKPSMQKLLDGHAAYVEDGVKVRRGA